jgi:hypothetical protein
MDERSFLKWSIEHITDIETWDPGIKVCGEYSFFENIRNSIPLQTRIITWLSDYLKIMKMAHVKFNRVR